MPDNDWVRLRATLEEETSAMSWRLAKLSDSEREGLLDELADRLIHRVHVRD